MRSAYDAVIIGSGPNGLAAGIVAAQRGLATLIIEGRDTIGGGLRSAALTLPGFVHDVCSSVHPMAAASPFFRDLPLAEHGLTWITPPAAAAHPLDDGDAAILYNDANRTADALGSDGARYQRTVGAIARRWPLLERDILGPFGVPHHPIAYGRFAVRALAPATRYATRAFATTRGRALFGGCAGHAIRPLSALGSGAFGLVLAASAHVRGWPVARGGSQSIARALAGHFLSLGGEIETSFAIERFDQLPAAKWVFFDTSPRAMARIMGSRFGAFYRRRLERYRYGPGAFKVDWALSAPIPWRSPECLSAATVHVGGSLHEIAAAEAAPWRDEIAERPFVIVTQPSLFDDTRAPPGRHTAWGYCHVPNGSTVDMTARIEAQIERFAPGFHDVILARAVRPPATLEQDNPNLVGGDVGGGSNALLNLLFRPTWRMYATPMRAVYLCSAATPPGGGVHGMCGYHAALSAFGPFRRGSKMRDSEHFPPGSAQEA